MDESESDFQQARSAGAPAYCPENPPPGVPLYTGIPEEHFDLWKNLSNFVLDEPEAERPFSRRLSSMFDWSEDFTARAILEYKRFIFLCRACEHVVSPSVTVDEVWHLHLQYTRSYYVKLCQIILGKIIHHNPSSGGAQEERKYHNAYVQTLNQYHRYFGIPPRDIWGPGNEHNVYSKGDGKSGRIKIIRE